LYLFARQLIAAGAPPALVLDTTPRANRLRALAHLPSFIASRYFFKGIGLLAAVSRRVPVVRDVTSLAIEGAERAKAIRWRTDAGWQERGCDLVLLHQGVVPNIDLWSSAGCRAVWNDGQACWHAEIDSWGQSSEAGILVAGDGAGIGGAEVAAIRGVLAGLQTAHLCGRIDAGSRDLQARAAFQALARLLRGRDFIDAAFLAPRWSRIPEAETLVCRCEEATMGDLVAAVRDGVGGPASLKTFSRCGMGPCQGRQCGLVVTEALAAALGRPPAEIGHFRSRPPVRPIPLGALAAIPATDEEMGSVVRL
ncbi:MAG: (2Fe-2S)-binding protein, partial [Reyranellaceae bacterium]